MQSKRFTKEDLACFNIDRQIFWNFWSRKIAVWAGFLFLSSLLFKKQNKKPPNLKTNQPEKKSKQKPQQTPFQNMVMSETKCWQQFYDMWGVPEEAAMKPLHKKKACGERWQVHPAGQARTARSLMFLLRSLLPHSQSSDVPRQPSWTLINSCTVLYFWASGHRSSLYLSWVNNRTHETRERQSSCI